MIEYEFTAGKRPHIFSCTEEERSLPRMEMLECPISLYIPRGEASDELQEQINAAIIKMVAELNSKPHTQGAKT